MHATRYLALWVSVTFLVSTSSRQIPKIGPYSFIVRERAQCDDEGTREIWASEVKFRKISRTTFQISLRFHSNITIDDSIEIHLNNAVWGNGGWKKNSLTYNHGPGCTVTKTLYTDWYEDVLPQLVEQLNVTDCPIPGPFSVFSTTTINPEKFLKASTYIPQLPYGRYKADMMAVKDGEIKGCFAAVVEIIPRQVKKKVLNHQLTSARQH